MQNKGVYLFTWRVTTIDSEINFNFFDRFPMAEARLWRESLEASPVIDPDTGLSIPVLSASVITGNNFPRGSGRLVGRRMVKSYVKDI